MTEVTDVREHHRNALLVRRSNRLVVAHASARLHDQGDSCTSKYFGAVAKRKEGVAGGNRIPGSLASARAGNAHRVNSVLLTRPDADGHAVFGEDDRVRTRGSAHDPRQGRVAQLLCSGLTLTHHSPLRWVSAGFVVLLHQDPAVDTSQCPALVKRRYGSKNPQIFLASKHLQRLQVEVGCHHHFGEDLVDGFGGRTCHWSVERHDAAERTHGIALKGTSIGGLNVVSN